MRQVPDSLTQAWHSQSKVGAQRAVGRAVIQKQNMWHFEYDTAWSQGGVFDAKKHRTGHFNSFIFGDKSKLRELRNIKSIEWERSVGQDAATCTIVLSNTELVPIGSPKDNPAEPDEFDRPGFYTFNRGDQTIGMNRWGFDDETGWNHVIMPDMVIKTYEGYGNDRTLPPTVDPNLVQTGVWLIDKVTYTHTGDITIESRDLARLLLDSAVFPPAVPINEYPLSWVATHSENVPHRDTTGGDWKDRMNRFGHATSSNDIYVGSELTNEPFPRYVSDSGGVEGHHANDAIQAHTGSGPGDDLNLFWRSTGQDTQKSFVWWQFNSDSGGTPVNGLRLRMQGGPYRVYVSIDEGDGWVGKKKIHYKLNDDDPEGPGNIDINAKVPFVASRIADRLNEFDLILPRVFNARKIRLTFTHLRDRGVGEHPYSAGLREFKIYTAGSVGALGFHKGNILEVIGNYGDYTHIVKWVCAWSGWYWPPHNTDRDFIRIQDPEDDAPVEYVTFDHADPVLPKGRVWGDFMKSGTAGIADLTVDMFDKKPMMDVINYVRDLLGFLFFIDETGGVVWRMPNLWSLGNYLSPEDIDGVPGGRGRHGRTTEIITLDEEDTLLSYATTLDSTSIRDRIFVGNVVGGLGIVIKGFNPNQIGLRRVAGWTDQHFDHRREAKIMADMVSAQQMFTYRTGSATIPGNPAIQVDDQIRIFERVTDETFYHYVMGIKSNLDMESGEWTYDIQTHWLGEEPSDAWVVKVDELTNATQKYLRAVGYEPHDSEDNAEIVGGGVE